MARPRAAPARPLAVPTPAPAVFRVAIRTHNRPRQLLNLLRDLRAERGPHHLHVTVWDDGSTESYAAAAALAAREGWEVRRVARHAKEGAWRLVTEVMRSFAGASPTDYLLFLDDDMRLSRRFFNRCLHAWAALPERGVALHLMIDNSRVDQPCWTRFPPRKANELLRQTQWLDGSWLCQRAALEALEWHVTPVPASRWATTEARSTGVGEDLSLRLHGQGLGIFQVAQSLLVHVPGVSQYNPKARKRTPLTTVAFVDGEPARRRKELAEPVEASLASIPWRERQLRQVIEALHPQVDVVRVYLNRYAKPPAFLERYGRVEYVAAAEHGDRGDAGKFFWADEAVGFQVICDDDLLYPERYVETMIGRLDRYQRHAVVGLHGVLLNHEVGSYYRDRKVTWFGHRLDRDEQKHLLGTGAIVYHADHLRVSRDDFPAPNMADIWLGLLCQAQAVPMMCVSRSLGWLKPLPTQGPDIYATCKTADGPQTEALKRVWPWTLPRLRSAQR